MIFRTLIILLLTTSSLAQTRDEIPAFQHPSGLDFHRFFRKNLDQSIFNGACIYSSGFIRFNIDSIGRLDSIDISLSIPQSMRLQMKRALKATDSHWSVRTVDGKATFSKPFILPISVWIEGGCRKTQTTSDSILYILNFRKSGISKNVDAVILAPLVFHVMRDTKATDTKSIPIESSNKNVPLFTHPKKYIEGFLKDRLDHEKFKDRCYFAFGFIRFNIDRHGYVDSIYQSASIPPDIQVILKDGLKATNKQWSPALNDGMPTYSQSLIMPVTVNLLTSCPTSSTRPIENTSFDLFNIGPAINQSFTRGVLLAPLFITPPFDPSKFSGNKKPKKKN